MGRQCTALIAISLTAGAIEIVFLLVRLVFVILIVVDVLVVRTYRRHGRSHGHRGRHRRCRFYRDALRAVHALGGVGCNLDFRLATAGLAGRRRNLGHWRIVAGRGRGGVPGRRRDRRSSRLVRKGFTRRKHFFGIG